MSALVLLVPALGGCAAQHKAAKPVAVAMETPPATPEPEWRTLVAPEDGESVDHLGTTLSDMQTRVRGRVAPADKPLLTAEPLDFPALSPGSYRCRALQLRQTPGGSVRLTSYPKQYCYVSGEGESLGFSKQTGSEGLAGYLHQDGDRYVFIGARQPRAGANSVPYRPNSAQKLVGRVERVGNFQWRLTVANTAPGGMDVYELVPASEQPRS